MAEYIDRQKVLDLAKTFSLDIDWDKDPSFLSFTYVTTNDIKTIPAADVRPVRRGKWEKADGAYCGGFTEDGDSITLPTVRCSVCKKLIAPVIWKNFCPNCGADMREKT